MILLPSDAVISLNSFMDTIILTRDFLHAVTPIGSNEDEAYRDILLVTVESNVQKNEKICSFWR